MDESLSRIQDWLAVLQTSAREQLAIERAMTKLSDAQREVMALYYREGLTLAEVAAEIGRSDAAVAGLWLRALRTLSILLKE